jgi:hypothetical protein
MFALMQGTGFIEIVDAQRPDLGTIYTPAIYCLYRQAGRVYLGVLEVHMDFLSTRLPLESFNGWL